MTSRRRVLRVHDGGHTTRPDTLTVEEPLEIRVAGNRWRPSGPGCCR
ncbi:hypothetical protein [Amycolatopsis plumensis]